MSTKQIVDKTGYVNAILQIIGHTLLQCKSSQMNLIKTGENVVFLVIQVYSFNDEFMIESYIFWHCLDKEGYSDRDTLGTIKSIKIR